MLWLPRIRPLEEALSVLGILYASCLSVRQMRLPGAPAHISCEKLLLLRGGLHAGCLQVLEQTKGVDVVLEPGLWPPGSVCSSGRAL